LSLYRKSAVRFTDWENHEHQSTHEASLTRKVFGLAAVVAYLGLALSAFVYVPFGEEVMNVVQMWLFKEESSPSWNSNAGRMNTKEMGVGRNMTGMWDVDASSARKKLNPSRLQDEMFAYTVTGQIVNAFLEVGLPYILRAIGTFRNGKRPGSPTGKKKRVVFEDEAKSTGNGEGKEGREFLENVRSEVALPEYEIYEDYSEMVTQFGYVALWSTIWPLAPGVYSLHIIDIPNFTTRFSVMALLNNFLESRSDAFKITVHNRRPIPTRTDTIGPWLDCLSFLAWISALTNSALVYLFHPQSGNGSRTIAYRMVPGSSAHPTTEVVALRSTRELLIFALLIALASSHGYIVLQAAVKHMVERAMWRGSPEVAEKERAAREVKESYFKKLEGDGGGIGSVLGRGEDIQRDVGEDEKAFWGYDEGLEDIRKLGKEE